MLFNFNEDCLKLTWRTSYHFRFGKDSVTSFPWCFLCFQVTAEISKIIKRTESDFYFTFNALLKMSKNVPCTRYETSLLTKKICLTIWNFRKGLVTIIYSIHELHCSISVNEKETLASIFKGTLMQICKCAYMFVFTIK